MSFSQGFSNGLSLMLSAERINLLKEERDLAKAREQELSKPVAEVDSQLAGQFTEGTTVREAGDIMSLRAQEQQMRASETDIEFREAQTETIKTQLEYLPENLRLGNAISKANLASIETTTEGRVLDNILKQRNIDNQRDYDNAKLGADLFTSLVKYGSDKQFMELKGSASYDAVIMGLASMAGKLDKDGQADVVSILSPEHAKAQQALNPVYKALQSGNIENINLGDYNSELNTLLGSRKSEFVGKNFKKEDGTKSKIVDLNIDFNSLEGISGSERSGGNVIIKGSFKLEDGTEVSSYIPDSSKAVISETQQSTDAFSVSLSDLMDNASSLKSLIDVGMNPDNVGAMMVARDVMVMKRNMFERDPNALININEKAIRAYQIEFENHATKLRTNPTIRDAITYIGGSDAAAESDAIKLINTQFNFFRDVDVLSKPEAEDAGIDTSRTDGPYYRFKRNDDGSLILPVDASLVDQNVRSVEENATLLKKGTAFEETPQQTIIDNTIRIGSYVARPTDSFEVVLEEVKANNPGLGADIDEWMRFAEAQAAENNIELDEESKMKLLANYPGLR